MKRKRLNILGLVYLAAALISLIICVWDVIILGLLAPAVDITGGIGVAMVCTLAELAICVLMVIIGVDMRKKFTAKTFKMSLLLAASSIFCLIFCLIGAYVVVPPILGLLLPIATILIIR